MVYLRYIMAKTTHKEQIISLKRIEGQVRGLQKMIEEGRYCVDILIQIHSTIGALSRVRDKVFGRHLEGCVTHAFMGKSGIEKQKKIDEIINLLKKLGRNS